MCTYTLDLFKAIGILLRHWGDVQSAEIPSAEHVGFNQVQPRQRMMSRHVDFVGFETIQQQHP